MMCFTAFCHSSCLRRTPGDIGVGMQDGGCILWMSVVSLNVTMTTTGLSCHHYPWDRNSLNLLFREEFRWPIQGHLHLKIEKKKKRKLQHIICIFSKAISKFLLLVANCISWMYSTGVQVTTFYCIVDTSGWLTGPVMSPYALKEAARFSTELRNTVSCYKQSLSVWLYLTVHNPSHTCDPNLNQLLLRKHRSVYRFQM